MKQRFREKCDICGKFSNYYQGYEMKIICDSCMEKIKNNVPVENNEEKLEEEPRIGQMDIFDFI